MPNKALLVLFLIAFLSVSTLYGQSRIKRIFQDNNYHNRTNVVKNQGENDYNILDEKFGDAKVGEVVRITTEKPKPEKQEKVKVVNLPPKKIPVVKEKKKEVLDPKGPVAKPAPAPRRTTFSASPSEYAPHKTYQAQLPKVKAWKKKRRKVRKRSRTSCYHFR